ncbi:MAG: AAA family ATPase [Candidatus Nanohaloarchaea archaeon]|nr:AAA family ATPase [Candidatus Nanohaloarchaea archaeon]
MARNVLVTGVPGSGKSTICSALQEEGYTAIDIEEQDDLLTMIDADTGSEFTGYDPRDVSSLERSKHVCDVDALQTLLEEHADEDVVFYCGNATNHADILPLFDDVFLLVPSEDVLRERLRTRDTSELGDDPAVREWVLGWKEEKESDIRSRGATVIDADRSVGDIVEQILEEIDGRR